MSDNTRSHGLTPGEWLQIYERNGWQLAVRDALAFISDSKHAEPEVKETACAIWNWLVINELLQADDAPDGRSLPQVICDAELAQVRGLRQINERERDLCRERLVGVQNVVRTIKELHEVDAKAKIVGHARIPQLETAGSN